jgi:5-methylcytosine-specific restriction protein B
MGNDAMTVFKQLRKRLGQELMNFDMQIKSSGTGSDDLKVELDPVTGYWKNPRQISSKPPRWIVQFEKNGHRVVATLPKQANGTPFTSARTLGYINNREGKCSVMVFRVFAAVKKHPSGYDFPGWEWLLVLSTNAKLPAGNSSEVIDEFDPQKGTIVYQRKTYKLSLAGLIKVQKDSDQIDVSPTETITYGEATDALRAFLEATSTSTATSEGE